jgi:hypothetical protein
MFLDCSTCFERPTTHHQKLKNCNCSFTYVCGCRQLSWLGHIKPEAAITVSELLMMRDVSLETYWAIKKHRNNKFYYTVTSCWFFPYDLYCDTRIHERHGDISYRPTIKYYFTCTRNLSVKLGLPSEITACRYKNRSSRKASHPFAVFR